MIDIKTIVIRRDRAQIAQWLFHILTQAWLHTQDYYRIRDVGLSALNAVWIQTAVTTVHG